MKLEEFDYYLPEELIAQVPIAKRDESRLLVVDKIEKTIEHKVFKNIMHMTPKEYRNNNAPFKFAFPH